MTNTTRPAEEDGGNAPVAWQERQTLAPQPGWTDWYPTNYEGVKGRTEAFEMTSSGITYQWRPLFLAPGAAAAAPAELEIKPPYWGVVHTERGGRVELSPQQYRQVLDGAFLRGVDAARAAQAQGGKA